MFNTNTEKPHALVHFTSLNDRYEYSIFRRKGNDTFEELAAINSSPYSDNTLMYGETYDYMVVSRFNNLVSIQHNIKSILVKSKNIQMITFSNPNYEFLDSNEITLSYYPDSNDCFENYEILIGTNKSNMAPYTITKERTVSIRNLNYQTTYYINIYPLNYKNEKTTNRPVCLAFTTAP
ncbi:MAG: hypothetical protein OMM_14895, partial [Candidatus Magnetoglobus multicellularis str. Araruama]